jgi:hypothetical protein
VVRHLWYAMLQGRALKWDLTPSHQYAIESLPGEVVAAGDQRTHTEALRLLAWNP